MREGPHHQHIGAQKMAGIEQRLPKNLAGYPQDVQLRIDPMLGKNLAGRGEESLTRVPDAGADGIQTHVSNVHFSRLDA